jgi:acrosin
MARNKGGRRDELSARFGKQSAHSKLAAAVEALESRVLLTAWNAYAGNYSFAITGNQLSVTDLSTNALTPDSPINIAPSLYTEVDLTGNSATNSFSVSGDANKVVISTMGGGDSIAVSSDTVNAQNIIIQNTGNTAMPDSLSVLSPTLASSNTTITESAGLQTIGVGDTTITNHDAALGQITAFGAYVGMGDTLFVTGPSTPATYSVQGAKLSITGQPNITYNNYVGLNLVAGGGDGDMIMVNGISGPTTISEEGTINNNTDPTGTVTFTVIASNDTLTLNSGNGGTDIYNLGGSAVSTLTAGSQAGGTANDTFNVSSNSTFMGLYGGSGTNVFKIQGNGGTLDLYGGNPDVADTFNILANSGTINAVAGSGTDVFNVTQTTSNITLTGGAGHDTFNILKPTIGQISVVGGTGTVQELHFTGTNAPESFVLTGSTIQNPGATVNYTGVTAVTLSGGGGQDNFLVEGDSAPTTLIGGGANDTYNLQADSASDPITVETISGANTINIGSNEPANFSNIQTFLAAVNVMGDGSDTVTIDDSGAVANASFQTGILSGSQLTGFSPAAIEYSGLVLLNLYLDNHGNALTVSGTSATTTNLYTGSGNDNVYVQADGGATNVYAGAGTNLIDIGSTAPASNGSLSNIQDALDIVGAGSDVLNVDDTGSGAARTGTINATVLHGLAPSADITYSGIGTLNITLSAAGNNITVLTTNASTTTNLYSGLGGDSVVLDTDAGPTHIYAQNGTNSVSIENTGAATSVTGNGSLGSATTVLVGTTEPTPPGLLSGIQFPLTVTGNAADTLVLDDTADSTAQTGKLTAAAVTGLGMGTMGVAYSGIGTLDVNLGSGGNTFLITGTSASVATVVNSGSGSDTVNLDQDNTPTTINSGSGKDAVNVLGTGAVTTINMGGGIDTVYVSTNAPNQGSLQNVFGQLTINGTTSTTVTLDDRGNPNPDAAAMLSDTVLTGVAPASIVYSGLGILDILLGSGGNTIGVTNTSATTTNLNTGAGADTVNISGVGASTTLNLDTGGGSNLNTVNVGDPGSKLAAVLGTLAITGNTHDTLNIDDAAGTAPDTGTLNSTSLTGLTDQPITWSGIITFVLSLGTQNNLLTVNNTVAGNTTINGNINQDTIHLLNESGPVTINSGAGADAIYVPITNAAVVINDSGGADVINIGTNSTAPASGKLSGLKSPVTITGDSADTVNVDDTGDTANQAFTITGAAVTDPNFQNINYGTLQTLNVYLGTGTDTVAVQGTSAITNIYTGAQADTINVGNAGIVSGIGSPLNIIGTGAADILNVNDSADTSATTAGDLTATQITGVSPAPITYAGVGALTISLGTAGNTFTITNTNAATTTILNSGTGVDTVTLVTDSGPTTINTQAGGDTVYVQATGGVTTINTGTPGSDTVDVGSVLPPPLFNGGVLGGINGKLTINGNGTDTVNLDDSGDGASVTGTLTPTAVQGLSPAEIDYSKLGYLNVALGTGNSSFTVTGTALGTNTAITTAGGTDAINVKATSGPLSVTTGGSNANTITIGSNAPAAAGNVDGIVGPVTVVGDSNDILIVDDTGSHTPRTGNLTGSVLTLGPATVDYSGLATLNVNLGVGADVFTVVNTAVGTSTTITTTVADTFNVQQTSSPTTIKTGSSASTVNVGNAGLLAGIMGLLTITGTASAAIVNVSDVNNPAPSLSGNLTSASITGLSPAAIDYAGVGKLTISLGGGGNDFTIDSTNATTNTTLNSGAGSDIVYILADAGPTTVNTQGGNDTVNVQTTNGVTAVNTGTGSDAVNVGSIAPLVGGTLDGIKGALTITADPTTLNLDDTASTAIKTATISGSSVTGLSPAAINYSGVVNLNIGLGSGGDTVKVTGTSASGGTVITGGVGSETFSVTAAATTGLPAQLLGPLTLDGGAGGTDTLTVSDALDKTGRTVVLSASTITGLGGAITYLDQSSLVLTLGAGTNSTKIVGIDPSTPTTVNVGGSSSSTVIAIPGDFLGTLVVNGNVGTSTIGGDLAGALTVNGALSGLTVTGNISGSIAVSGKLTSLTFGASQTGTITAGSVGTIAAPAATAQAGGVVLSVKQNNVLRQVIATDTLGDPLSPASFKLLYDGSTIADPQVAIRATNTSGNRFDLLLTAPVGSNFDLSRLDSSGGAINVRNVTVEGNSLATVSSPEASNFGLASGTVGGVYLPSDNVGGVETWGSLAVGTIRAASIEGIAFATLVKGSTVYKASSLTSEGSESTLLTALAANPTAKKLTYYEAIALPTETLKVVFSTTASVSLFVDGTEGNDDTAGENPTANNGDFEEHGVAFTDELAGSKAPITALATFASNSAKHTTNISQLSFIGDGGSVNSVAAIVNITSTGALGDLLLQGNAPSEAATATLNTVTAPSIFGNINLYGGTLVGSIQTTGIRFDPVTGAPSAVAADLGATTLSSGKVNGVTTIALNMGPGSQIISRGSLLSTTTLGGALLGTIAAQGNIGFGVVASGKLTRYGGIKVSSTALSSGNIVALGNIFGDISIGGSFSGRIAAEGAAISGLASSRVGILGNLTLSGGIASGGAVLSGGLIGDSAGSTKLTVTASKVLGFAASKGALTASATLPSGHVFQNASGANLIALNAIWTNGGTPITTFDLTPGDLAGLGLVMGDVLAIKVVSNNLTGTTP